jgi:hypothetical protein
MLGAKVWLSSRGSLEGALGAAHASLIGPFAGNGYHSYGAIATVAGGYELISRPSFALDAQLRVTEVVYGAFSTTSATLGLKIEWLP